MSISVKHLVEVQSRLIVLCQFLVKDTLNRAKATLFSLAKVVLARSSRSLVHKVVVNGLSLILIVLCLIFKTFSFQFVMFYQFVSTAIICVSFVQDILANFIKALADIGVVSK